MEYRRTQTFKTSLRQLKGWSIACSIRAQLSEAAGVELWSFNLKLNR